MHKKPKEKRWIRTINHRTVDNFRNDLAVKQWSDILEIESADEAFTQFHKEFCRMYDQSFPNKHFKVKHNTNDKPWITSAIISQMKYRDKLYKKFLKSKCQENWATFKTSRNKVTQMIRKAKYNIISKMILTSKAIGRKSDCGRISIVLLVDILIKHLRHTALRYQMKIWQIPSTHILYMKQYRSMTPTLL